MKISVIIFFREQKRAIEEELGEDDSPIDDAENYVDKIEKLNLDEKSADILYKECKKLSKSLMAVRKRL